MAYAGLFNEKIEIYDFVKTKSDKGVVTNDKQLIYTTRAKIGHVGGSRTVINDEIAVPYSKNFVVRIYVPITDTSWIKYNDKFWRVMSIDKDKALQQEVVITELVQE